MKQILLILLNSIYAHLFFPWEKKNNFITSFKNKITFCGYTACVFRKYHKDSYKEYKIRDKYSPCYPHISRKPIYQVLTT